VRVTCEVTEDWLPGDFTDEVEGTRAVCSRCGHGTESYGTTEASVLRCLALMREECPEDESNFYVDGG
jgi:hypothetical protein